MVNNTVVTFTEILLFDDTYALYYNLSERRYYLKTEGKYTPLPFRFGADIHFILRGLGELKQARHTQEMLEDTYGI